MPLLRAEGRVHQFYAIWFYEIWRNRASHLSEGRIVCMADGEAEAGGLHCADDL